MATSDPAPAFNADRPDDLRQGPPWHPLAYIIRKLPESLEAIARGLELPDHPRILDFGCAELPYRRFFPTADFIGADLPGNPAAAVEIRADGTVPVADAAFDLVLSTQVLEHVGDPEVYLAESYRVLRPGGQLLLSTHGMMVYHPDPVDYWRWTCAGLQRVVEAAGFRVLNVEGIMGLAATGLQFTQDAIYWRMPRRPRPAFAYLMQKLVAVADRWEGAESRRFNALVFALVAVKP